MLHFTAYGMGLHSLLRHISPNTVNYALDKEGGGGWGGGGYGGWDGGGYQVNIFIQRHFVILIRNCHTLIMSIHNVCFCGEMGKI